MQTRALSNSGPTRRLILLGASNLTRGLAVVLQTVSQLYSEPLDILVAAGHGRSYGTISRVFARSLPGIVPCGLWSALAARPALPTSALVTDIGNDLFYGAAPQQIAQWVATCFDRLQQYGARVTVTGLPLCNLPRVTPVSYRLIVQMLFPGCRLPYEAAIQGACQLDALVRQLAAERQIPVFEPLPQWYGVDPVHIRLRDASAAWQAILGAGFQFDSPPGLARITPLMHLRAALLRPEQRWVLGREHRQAQPACVLANGTQVSLY